MLLLRLCKKYGVFITTGSDSHIDTELGDFRYVYDVLEECDFPEELVVTTSYEKLVSHLKHWKKR